MFKANLNSHWPNYWNTRTKPTRNLITAFSFFPLAVFLTLFTTASLFACTGDCLSCHQSLKDTIHDDPRHKAMLTCIQCHSEASEAMLEQAAACGDDCFACHNVNKVIDAPVPQHKVITHCIKCHLHDQTNPFGQTDGLNQFFNPSASEFLPGSKKVIQ